MKAAAALALAALSSCGNYVELRSDEQVDTYLNRGRTITDIDLAGPGISDRALERIARASGATGLVVRACPEVTDEGVRRIGACGTLRHLSLINLPGVTAEGLAELPGLRALESLILWNLKADGRMLEPVSRIPNLSELVLSNCPGVKDEHLLLLRDCDELRSLALTECPISPTALDELRAALPGCSISTE